MLLIRSLAKKIVILSQIATTASIVGLLVFSINYGLSLYAIYTTTVLISIASTFSGTAFTSSITGLIDEERVQKAMSLNQMAISFSAIASPAVAGLLYGTVPMPVFLGMYAGASLIAVALESTMNFNLFANRKVKDEGAPKEKVLASMKAGLSYARLQPLLMAMIWVALLVNFLYGAVIVGYSFILIEKLKIASQHFGIIEGVMAAGMLLMSIYLAVRKQFTSPLVISKWGIIGLGVVMSLIAIPLVFTFSYGGMVAFYALLSLFSGSLFPLINTPLQVLMMKLIEDDYKGRVFSILETMAMALMPLGMVLFGFLYDLFPATWILIGTSILLISTVLILLRSSVVKHATKQELPVELETVAP